MRIDRLDLTAFGPFTNVTLDLCAGNQGVHVVYGPNEAGKSSSLRAIRQLFVGIEHRSTDDFVHPHPKMRIGARLRNHSGDVLEIVRLKRQKSALQSLDGTPIDEAELVRFLGGVRPGEFVRKFAIDRDELLEGGRSVVQEHGDLGRMLFAAGGSSLGKVGAVLAKLDDEAEALFKKSGRIPRINAGLSELEKLRGQLKLETLASSEWSLHSQNLEAARAREKQVGEEISAATRERNRLGRLSQSLEPIAERAATLEALAGLANVPRLSADFRQRRLEAQTLLPSLERSKNDILAKVEQLDVELKSLEVPETLLEQTARIEALFKRLELLHASDRERAKLEIELVQLENEATAILRDLGREPTSLEIDARESLRIKARDRLTVEELARQRQAVWQACEQAERAVRDLEKKLQLARKKLVALPPDRDSAALEKTLKHVSKQGDLDKQLSEMRIELASHEANAKLDLKRLGFWSGPLGEVEGLAVPLVETVERFRDELDGLLTRKNDLDRRIAELRQAVELNDRDFELNRLGGNVLTPEVLEQARRDRAAHWERLKTQWDDAIAESFEQSVDHADEVADHLFRDATRVMTQTRLFAERARAMQTLETLRSERSETEGQYSGINARWDDIWLPIAIASPAPPKEMLAWFTKLNKLAEAARSIREKAERVIALQNQIATFSQQLIECFAHVGDVPGQSSSSLAAIVEHALEVVDGIRKQTRAREKLNQDFEAIEAERPNIEETLSASREERDRWQGRWAEAMSTIGLPADALPAEASMVMSRNVELFATFEKMEKHRAKIAAISAESAQFGIDVWKLAELIAPDLVSVGAAFVPSNAVETLFHRLKNGEKVRNDFEQLVARLLANQNDLESTRQAIAVQTDRLDALCHEARCKSIDELSAIEESWSDRERLERDRDEVEKQLRRLALGSDLDAFVVEASRIDPDAVVIDLQRLDQRLETLAAEHKAINQTIGSEGAKLEQMTGGSKAAESGQEAEDLRARVRLDVEQYARLRLASAVLRTGIERYRNKTQGPALARASKLFAALTLDSFSELRVDTDVHGTLVLKGVRPGASEPLGVESMSLGTADQLYLALRLATLESTLDRNEPLPLIVDDILVQFDDARTKSALGVLADLSDRTQVLVFTHHEHLVRLAEQQIDRSRLFTHILPTVRPLAEASSAASST